MLENESNKDIVPDCPIVTEISPEEIVHVLHPVEDLQSTESTSLAIDMPNRLPNTVVCISPEISSQSAPTPESNDCNLCENRRFQEDDASPHNRRILKPCFCNFRVHHGCLADLMETQKKCLLCGVKYRYYRYGTKRDFLLRYWYQFASVGFICFFLIALGMYGLSHSFPTESLTSISLLIVSSSIFIIGFCFLVVFNVKMFQVRYPRFKLRYGNLTVFDYKPEANSRGSAKPKISEFKTLYRQADNTVYFNVTAGQYLLGHKKNHSGNLASTPMETAEGQPPVKFSFDTPAEIPEVI